MRRYEADDMFLTIILIIKIMQSLPLARGAYDREAATLALEYVNRVEQSPCTGGTEETLHLTFNHSVWNEYTRPAILTSNFLSSVMMDNDGTLDSLTDEMFFTFVKNNVNGDSVVYGSGIAVDRGVYTKYSAFCPYAYRKNGTIHAHDISLFYNYFDNRTEWFWELKLKNWDNATTSDAKIEYRSGNISLPEQNSTMFTATVDDGHWTKPYYDCGGGDVWMVTFISPLLYVNKSTGKPQFRGIASIDIELTNIDINQCDADSNSFSALDVFRGTHRCPATTECSFLPGHGFKRGAYHCICQKGYYYPEKSAYVKAFSGSEIENAFYYQNSTFDVNKYKCLACKEGCETCVDDSPCLYEFSFVFRFLVLLVIFFTFVAIGLLSVVTTYNRNELAIKTGSPIFLLFMCVGGMLMCCTGFIAYPKSSDILCIIENWTFHLGFILMYGALIVKTWRIAVLFRPASKLQRIHLPDKVLVRRLIPGIVVTCIYLIIWSIAERGKTETLETSSLLKYEACYSSYWVYTIQSVEVCTLLVGVYICYIVRKAPGHFNESKYITWSIYNGIILGSFLLIITHLLGRSYGPDLLYLLKGLQIQAFVTITISLIFIPKMLALYRKEDIRKLNDTFVTTFSKYARSGIMDGSSTKSIGVQTDNPTANSSNSAKDKKFWNSLKPNNKVEPSMDTLGVPDS